MGGGVTGSEEHVCPARNCQCGGGAWARLNGHAPVLPAAWGGDPGAAAGLFFGESGGYDFFAVGAEPGRGVELSQGAGEVHGRGRNLGRRMLEHLYSRSRKAHTARRLSATHKTLHEVLAVAVEALAVVVDVLADVSAVLAVC